MKTTNALLKLTLTFILAISSQLILAQQPTIGYFRLPDQQGVNVFESPVEDNSPFEGVKVRIGGNFAQQFQGIKHSNEATPRIAGDDINLNELYSLGSGFNLATANLNMDVQLAKGVRLNVITYLSARHHPEAWVKGGYIQFDELSIFDNDAVNNFMDRVTIKVGHMEVNYGDQHFRRSDNGNALYNPFVGNHIMDAFATEIGGEFYYRPSDFLFMVGLSSGLIKGDVSDTDSDPSVYFKAGWDKQVNPDLRLRLTGSLYNNSGSARNTLYSGDRAGSRYYLVMEGAFVRDWRTGNIGAASATSQFTSGRMNPDFSHKINALVINPFIKYKGVEFFGTIERAEGRNSRETDTRVWNQFSGELILRMAPREQFFLGTRYNRASGPLAGTTDDIAVSRRALSLGWFITKNVVAKFEYVAQNYKDFAPTDIRHEGQFDGIMIEAVVGF